MRAPSLVAGLTIDPLLRPPFSAAHQGRAGRRAVWGEEGGPVRQAADGQVPPGQGTAP